MRIPYFETRQCPSCKEESAVRITDTEGLWFANTLWRCPYCGGYFSTEEMQEIDEIEKETKK